MPNISGAKLNIVVPMAGRGTRFSLAGYRDPKPFIPVGGKPMIERVIENIRPQRQHRFIFICLEEHLKFYPMREGLHALCPDCEIVTVDRVTEGAACTVLLARDLIDNGNPVMIANSDQFVECSIDDYLSVQDQTDCDGLIMTFWAEDSKWSYCRMRDDGTVLEVVEKEVVSNVATVGIYNFAHGHDFVRGADEMIAQNQRVNGEFYVAPVYNLLIQNGRRIVTCDIGRERTGMHGLGTPEDLDRFLSSDVFHKRVQVP